MDVIGWQAWVVIGGVAGWLTSIAIHSRQGWPTNIVIGAVALLGMARLSVGKLRAAY